MTVHPAPLSGDYLTVADAMNQVLDLVEALEKTEANAAGERQIVWRLTEARTNSPPFTVVAEAFPIRPSLSIALEANRVTARFADEVNGLLSNGRVSSLVAEDAFAPVTRLLERTMNGVGRTEVKLDDVPVISIQPQSARAAKVALDRYFFDLEAGQPDWKRSEFGSAEGEIVGLTRWNGRPALLLMERLTQKSVTCVLSDELSQAIGPAHQWNEVWEGRRVIVTGILHFNSLSDLKRADIETIEEIEWTDVSLADIRELDAVAGRTVAEHLALVRSGSDG